LLDRPLSSSGSSPSLIDSGEGKDDSTSTRGPSSSNINNKESGDGDDPQASSSPLVETTFSEWLEKRKAEYARDRQLLSDSDYEDLIFITRNPDNAKGRHGIYQWAWLKVKHHQCSLMFNVRLH
jgi:hypothetical protein